MDEPRGRQFEQYWTSEAPHRVGVHRSSPEVTVTVDSQ
jgi:hypothetical protein